MSIAIRHFPWLKALGLGLLLGFMGCAVPQAGKQTAAETPPSPAGSCEDTGLKWIVVPSKAEPISTLAQCSADKKEGNACEGNDDRCTILCSPATTSFCTCFDPDGKPSATGSNCKVILTCANTAAC